MKQKLATVWAMFLARVTAVVDEYNASMAQWRRETGGQINIQSALTIAGIVITAVVGLAVLASLAPTWFNSTKDLVDEFSTADVGDSTANSLAQNVFPLIIGLLGVFAIAGLAFLVMKFRKS